MKKFFNRLGEIVGAGFALVLLVILMIYQSITGQDVLGLEDSIDEGF